MGGVLGGVLVFARLKDVTGLLKGDARPFLVFGLRPALPDSAEAASIADAGRPDNSG